MSFPAASVPALQRIERLLVIRRDNIGDLVCTTPLITALRRRHPAAWIGALVNSYNAPVLEGNPDLSAVVAYRKLKHLGEGESALAALRERLADLWRLRRMRLDCALIATSDFNARTARMARWLAPARLLGFSDGSARARCLDLSEPVSKVAGLHEVERVFALGAHLGVVGEIPPLRVVPDTREVERAAARMGTARPRVAVHVSARRPAQRWPAERFAVLIERVHAAADAIPVLLWSPGPSDHPQHPGDDAKAEEIKSRLGGQTPLVDYRTEQLGELIGALAACDIAICADGGALHLAAALGKPVVCLFGDSPPERWRPWGVPHRVLRPASRDVADIGVEDVLRAFLELRAERAARR